jgi:hypothetical protein
MLTTLLFAYATLSATSTDGTQLLRPREGPRRFRVGLLTCCCCRDRLCSTLCPQHFALVLSWVDSARASTPPYPPPSPPALCWVRRLHASWSKPRKHTPLRCRTGVTRRAGFPPRVAPLQSPRCRPKTLSCVLGARVSAAGSPVRRLPPDQRFGVGIRPIGLPNATGRPLVQLDVDTMSKRC